MENSTNPTAKDTGLPPLKKALRNAAVLTALVGILVQFQQSDYQAALSSMLITFAAVFPALWLSFRLTRKWANASAPEK